MQAQAKPSYYYEMALTLVPWIGNVLAKNLISYCGSAEEVFKQKKQKLLRIPGIGEKAADAIIAFKEFDRVENELLFIEKHKINTLFYASDAYPKRLKQIDDSPAILYYLGNADLNNSKIVGIVGTRKASDYGKHIIDEICEMLKPTGSLILSGLAYGIDIHAHKSAIKNSLPTVGVMAHGLDRIYPAQHAVTAKRMIENGGLLTEYMSQTNPDRENFPTRNRIVAGLCDVLLVIETAERGGAMITAELANGYNKELMAVPGRVGDLYSAGCNKLIQQNKAAILTKPEDIISWMNWESSSTTNQIQQELPLNLGEDELNVINYIRQKQKVGIDIMSHEMQIDSSNLSLLLLGLEMQGLIRSLPGKNFELI